MNHDDPSQSLESMLQAARAQRAPAATRAGVRAAVGIAAGAGSLTVAGAAGAASKAVAAKTAAGALSTSLLAKYVVLGVACGAVTVSVAHYAESPSAPPEPKALAPLRAPPTSSPDVVQTPALVEAYSAPTASSSAPPPAAPPPLAAPPTATLADELRLIDDTRAALRRGDVLAAQRALGRHAREFPGGQMVGEATVLRIELLMLTGDQQGARSLAKAFTAAHPRSLLLPRVRAIVPDVNP